MATLPTKSELEEIAKTEKGVIFSKRDYVTALKEVYKNPPFMGKAYGANAEPEYPYLYVPLKQSRDAQFCPDPFGLFIQWFGIYGDKGYIFIGNSMVVNGCTPKDFQDLMKRIKIDSNYYPYTNRFMTPASQEALC